MSQGRDVEFENNSLFVGKSTGKLLLCVKVNMDSLFRRLSFQAGIKLMSGWSSDVWEVKLGPYIRGKNGSCSKEGYISPLNSPTNFKNQAG